MICKIWQSILPALISDHLRRYLVHLPSNHTWVHTPNQGTVATWILCKNYDGDKAIYLFQDGRIVDAHRNSSASIQELRAYVETETIWHDRLGQPVERLVTCEASEETLKKSCFVANN